MQVMGMSGWYYYKEKEDREKEEREERDANYMICEKCGKFADCKYQKMCFYCFLETKDGKDWVKNIVEKSKK